MRRARPASSCCAARTAIRGASGVIGPSPRYSSTSSAACHIPSTSTPLSMPAPESALASASPETRWSIERDRVDGAGDEVRAGPRRLERRRESAAPGALAIEPHRKAAALGERGRPARSLGTARARWRGRAGARAPLRARAASSPARRGAASLRPGRGCRSGPRRTRARRQRSLRPLRAGSRRRSAGPRAGRRRSRSPPRSRRTGARSLHRRDGSRRGTFRGAPCRAASWSAP